MYNFASDQRCLRCKNISGTVERKDTSKYYSVAGTNLGFLSDMTICLMFEQQHDRS